MHRNGDWVQTKLKLITSRAQRDRGCRFTTLAYLLDEGFLAQCFMELKREKAPGIDGVRWEEYAEKLTENLRGLVSRLKAKRYWPQPVKRVYIPKDEKTVRPLGLPVVEDKVVQMGITRILEAIFEVDFLEISYGFRRNRSCHDALDRLNKVIMTKPVNYLVEADIRGFFEHVDHKWMMECLRQRISDPSFLRLIGRFLRAGIMEEGKYIETDEGTPQGGVLSPVLSNIYLHYVLDLWFEKRLRRELCGYAEENRYADDCAPRRRGKEAARSNGSSFAAREMRGGPSGSGCRTRAQTTGCCSGPMIGVVSETEKAGPTRQVCAVKTNASEPSMTCRKRRDVHRNRAPVVGSGPTRGKPVDCSRGDRHEDGVSAAQALVRNVGTFRLDAKRELQAVDP